MWHLISSLFSPTLYIFVPSQDIIQVLSLFTIHISHALAKAKDQLCHRGSGFAPKQDSGSIPKCSNIWAQCEAAKYKSLGKNDPKYYQLSCWTKLIHFFFCTSGAAQWTKTWSWHQADVDIHSSTKVPLPSAGTHKAYHALFPIHWKALHVHMMFSKTDCTLVSIEKRIIKNIPV